MSYTIGQISEATGLSIHTLRYYEKEGIMPFVKRNDNGIRIYEKEDFELLRFICCLRATGMAIVDIKKFVALIMQGNETIDQRIVMLNNQKETIKSKVDHLMSYIDMLNNKINFYKNML
ncbi:MerR family transcriptional regulator [Bacillus paramycoides]|uniref:MerR family transcriptional regulator n=1 Tax=Bacillus paramycoides TaxID=2026194 RepID=UPI002244BA7A|nr:MerR family transcriptional regulator [Bacillus paramycoides]MCW9134101.1 MerR family transcriptional regulator [Bacillus paramycoides]